MSEDVIKADPPDPRRVDGAADSGAESSAHGHRNLGIALALISMAQLMVVLDGTIVNIALPHIQTDLGFTNASLPWVVNAYALAFGGLLLLGGRMGDILGRRKVFIFGVVLFGVASFLGGIAQSETMLLASRILQGVGAAAASPNALALITTTFPAGKERNRAMGVYAAMSGAGAAVGLILGGALTEASWRWTFFINTPIGLIVAVLALRYLGESARQTGKFDLPGAITGTVGLTSLVYGLTHAAQSSWSDATTVAFIAAGVVLIAVFLTIEARSRHALMPFRILANRTRGVSFFVMLIVGAALFSMFYFLGIFIQNVMGYSALKTGFAFLPFSFGIVVAAQVASALIARLDPRWIMRRRDVAGRGRHVRLQPAGGGLDLPHPRAAVHPAAVLRHGPALRAAHLDRGQRCRQRGLGRRLRSIEHGAADRWCDRPGAARHGLHHRDQGQGHRARTGDRQGRTVRQLA